MDDQPKIDVPRTVSMPVGVILRVTPGVTRWQAEVWSLAGVIPFAPPAAWRVLREAGDVAEWHAATLALELHRSDTDSLVQNLAASDVPSVWVALRGAGRPEPHRVTASPFEASFNEIDGEDRVEKVAMPPAMQEWVKAFVVAHHEDVPFVKRRRDRREEGDAQNGIGDARIRQGADVWRTPKSLRTRK
ncbi:DUF3305 domain-containing protein [Jannaschia seosinensis]|nr:DUF3305 domain-containing protein [Jannaschia seosinensis]